MDFGDFEPDAEQRELMGRAEMLLCAAYTGDERDQALGAALQIIMDDISPSAFLGTERGRCGHAALAGALVAIALQGR